MPEAGRHAPILIATSWQALGRAINEGPDALICNCTVVVLFAGFFVEANLNHIVQRLGKGSSLAAFAGGKKYPGLQDKLAWFYNEFVARVRRPNVRTANRYGIGKAVRRRFLGFAGLYRFRNDISHGVINKTGRSLVKAHSSAGNRDSWGAFRYLRAPRPPNSGQRRTGRRSNRDCSFPPVATECLIRSAPTGARVARSGSDAGVRQEPNVTDPLEILKAELERFTGK
jgi:hypothetical protein